MTMTTSVLKKSISVLVMFGIMLMLGAMACFGEGNKLVPPEGNKKAQWLVNINTGGISELTKLPRIGEKKARRIIEYREKNGKFKKIQDLMKVKGIGEKTFKKFERLLTI